MRSLIALAAVLIVVGLLLVIGLAMLAVVERSQRRPTAPRPLPAPDPDAGNQQWERYYRDMETQARDAGNGDSADTYASLADTYRNLARGGGDA